MPNKWASFLFYGDGVGYGPGGFVYQNVIGNCSTWNIFKPPAPTTLPSRAGLRKREYGVMEIKVARKGDYEFDANVPLEEARLLIEKYHYARGASNTRTDLHGFRKNGKLVAVAWWLPPTRVACESVSKDDWKKVISLSRLVVHPDEPKNVCSMLIGASIRKIKNDGRWKHLVTYADHAQGHTGAIYRATNWEYVGTTGPYTKWIDKDGKQTACKATKNRKKSEMEAIGMIMVGRFHKEKFVMHL